jgi:hypothetical protein
MQTGCGPTTACHPGRRSRFTVPPTIVGTGIAGFRAKLGLIDDPIRSRQDADSELIRDRIWDWYINDFKTADLRTCHTYPKVETQRRRKVPRLFREFLGRPL